MSDYIDRFDERFRRSVESAKAECGPHAGLMIVAAAGADEVADRLEALGDASMSSAFKRLARDMRDAAVAVGRVVAQRDAAIASLADYRAMLAGATGGPQPN